MIMQNAKIPSLEISVTAEGITEIGDYIFRNSVPESMNIPQTAKKDAPSFRVRDGGDSLCP